MILYNQRCISGRQRLGSWRSMELCLISVYYIQAIWQNPPQVLAYPTALLLCIISERVRSFSRYVQLGPTLDNMTSSQALNYEAIATQLLEQLSRTPYACSSLSPRLGSLPVNFVYRGILAKPILAQDTVTTKSIIIKHSPDALPKVFEELLLNSLSNISTSITGANVKSPRLYLYDRETNTQVFEDLSDTIQFMTVLSSANIHSLLPFPSTTTVGRHLGVWLRSFHIWASSPDQVDLRKHICQNDHMRKTKYIFTYDSVFKVLKIFPELLEGFEQTLSTILDIIAKEFERPTTVEGEDYGLLHGDLWSGK